MENNISNFFYPNSICIAGASTKEKSIGYEILKTIKQYGYKGKIYPVNPKADNILGYRCYQDITDIGEPLDLGLVVVPKKYAEDSIIKLLDLGVTSIILVTAGFREIGGEGAEAEKRIIDLIKKRNARLVGPNCMGVINTLSDIKLNATFVAEEPKNGRMAFLSQSGALGAAVLNSLRETDIKFAHFISVGNKADINENDIIDFWQNDENISSITLYLESFENGFEFISKFALRKITKPVIILKAGRTEGGMRAASSHTGALSSGDKVVNSLLNQFGIIRSGNLNEMFNTAKGFEHFPMPKGNRIGVVTNAGGPAILAIDALEKAGLKLAELSNETKLKLKEYVHPEGSVNNPVDLLPGGTADVYKKVNELLIEDNNVDAVISIFVEPVMVKPFPVIENINSIITDKPILQVAMPLPEFWNDYSKNSKWKKPVFKNPEDPAKVISDMLFFQNRQRELDNDGKEYSSMLNKFNYHSDKTAHNSHEYAADLCSKYDIPLVQEKYFSTEEIQNYEGSFPVVLKGINKNYSHKTEVNAVRLNIKDKKELLEQAESISKSFGKMNAEVEQFLVQQFIEAKYELLIGGYRDPSFGPVIMFGSGGKYVEVFDDTSMISAIASRKDILNLINSTKIGKILQGVRNEKPVDVDTLMTIIQNACSMILENPEINEFDFNPVIVDENGSFYAVDVRIK